MATTIVGSSQQFKSSLEIPGLQESSTSTRQQNVWDTVSQDVAVLDPSGRSELPDIKMNGRCTFPISGLSLLWNIEELVWLCKKYHRSMCKRCHLSTIIEFAIHPEVFPPTRTRLQPALISTTVTSIPF